jgi:hypothetical protein
MRISSAPEAFVFIYSLFQCQGSQKKHAWHLCVIDAGSGVIVVVTICVMLFQRS